MKTLTVIGGGLAGTEAAWQAAQRGVHVKLYEMRPQRTTPAHVTDNLAELVCSNSLGSLIPHKAPGLLKAEMRGLGSLILRCASESAVPAGSSLAVDRDRFAALVAEAITTHSHIELVREEVTHIPDDACIVATGPLTSDALATEIAQLSGRKYLYFYDALSPIVNADSIDMSIAFRQSRHDDGELEAGDYINCALDKASTMHLSLRLVSAEQIELRDFERKMPSSSKAVCRSK